MVFVAVPLVQSKDAGAYRELSLSKNTSVIEGLRQTVATADATLYASIAEEGYDRQQFDDKQHNWATFPAYPLLVSLFRTDFFLTGVLVSNAFFLGGLLLLVPISKMFGWNDEQAIAGAFYLAIYPTSYFFSMPLTESMFLFVSLLSIWLALKNQWWLAGLAGAIASGTRMSGVLLVAPLLILYLQRRRNSIRADILALLLVPVGLLAFMVFLWRVTGNPLALTESYSAYGRGGGFTFFLWPLIEFVIHPRGFAGWQFVPTGFCLTLLAFFCVYRLVRWKEWALAAYGFLSLFLPLTSGTLAGIPRYIMVIFPVCMVLARSRYPRVLTFLFLTLFALMTLFCALHYTFAVA
jgi:hypothetical protein